MFSDIKFTGVKGGNIGEFTPERIAASSKKLGLSSEASQRFEKGVDPNGIIRASNRATSLLADIAGGSVLKGIVDNYPKHIEAKKIFHTFS